MKGNAIKALIATTDFLFVFVVTWATVINIKRLQYHEMYYVALKNGGDLEEQERL